MQLNDIAIERYKTAEAELTAARACIRDLAGALEHTRMMVEVGTHAWEHARKAFLDHAAQIKLAGE